MDNSLCRHVTENVGPGTCPDCGKPTHWIDWDTENRLYREWKLANPNAKSGEWWSI